MLDWVWIPRPRCIHRDNGHYSVYLPATVPAALDTSLQSSKQNVKNSSCFLGEETGYGSLRSSFKARWHLASPVSPSSGLDGSKHQERLGALAWSTRDSGCLAAVSFSSIALARSSELTGYQGRRALRAWEVVLWSVHVVEACYLGKATFPYESPGEPTLPLYALCNWA